MRPTNEEFVFWCNVMNPKGIRLGQSFMNHFWERVGHWPELFYEPCTGKAWAMIERFMETGEKDVQHGF